MLKENDREVDETEKKKNRVTPCLVTRIKHAERRDSEREIANVKEGGMNDENTKG